MKTNPREEIRNISSALSCILWLSSRIAKPQPRPDVRLNALLQTNCTPLRIVSHLSSQVVPQTRRDCWDHLREWAKSQEQLRMIENERNIWPDWVECEERLWMQRQMWEMDRMPDYTDPNNIWTSWREWLVTRVQTLQDTTDCSGIQTLKGPATEHPSRSCPERNSCPKGQNCSCQRCKAEPGARIGLEERRKAEQLYRAIVISGRLGNINESVIESDTSSDAGSDSAASSKPFGSIALCICETCVTQRASGNMRPQR